MDLTTLPSSIALSGADLDGPLEPTGPRAGADRGSPVTATRVIHDDGVIGVGMWACTPGGWSIENRPNTEIVHSLRGAATITDADGSVRELVTGSTCGPDRASWPPPASGTVPLSMGRAANLEVHRAPRA
jgi:hypothetical protein